MLVPVIKAFWTDYCNLFVSISTLVTPMKLMP